MVPEMFTNVVLEKFRAEVNHGCATHKVRSSRHKMRQNYRQTGKVPEELPRLAKCAWLREAVPVSAACQALTGAMLARSFGACLGEKVH